MMTFSQAPLRDDEIDYLCEGIAARPVAYLDGICVDMEALIVRLMSSGEGRAGLRKRMFAISVREYLGLPDHADVEAMASRYEAARRADFLARTRGWPGLPDELRLLPDSWPFPDDFD